MVEVYNTHMFMYALKSDAELKKHFVIFLNRENKEIKIKIEKLEVKSSPLSCKIWDFEGKKHLVPYIRIRKILKGNELVWDSTDVDLDNVKVIKGY
ncbi:MAG: hypothetical protein ACOCXG_01225 [Nanoarchaeota archaeon]